MGIISAIFGEKGPVAPAAVPADPKTLPADGNYPNVFAVEKVFSIAPKPLDVGLKRSKQLKDRSVVYGSVTSGAFTKGDNVIATIDGKEMQIPILDIIPEGGSDFATELGSNLHKKSVDAGKYGWMILDVTSLPAENSKIGKL
ncbi:MAG: hypothetical protein II461_06510 [Treponema sp.]|nr:hypothetical protein [Treponema sp.]